MDAAHKWTDREIEGLEKRIRAEYGKAARDMNKRVKKFMEGYGEQRERLLKALDEGIITKAQFDRSMASQAAVKARDREMLMALATAARMPKEAAYSMINGSAVGVYAENANYAMYTIGRAARINTSFAMVSKDAVKVLMRDNPKLLPLRADANIAEDIAWHTRKFVSAMTQSMLLGESVPDTATRMTRVLGIDANAATRTARTAMTAAENIGRMDAYERAEEMGIKGVKVWEATLDDRTRDSHREADGERVGIHEKFSNGLEEPGDPNGDPEEVYNCRCAMRFEVEDVEQAAIDRFERLPRGMSYEEWKAGGS